MIFTKENYKEVVIYRSKWVPPESNIIAKSLGKSNVKKLIGLEVLESVLKEMIEIKKGYIKRKQEKIAKKKRELNELTKKDYAEFCQLFFSKRRTGKTINEMIAYDIDWAILSGNIKSMVYKEFLDTEYWRLIRARKIEEADNRCSKCGGSRLLQVHHKTYENHGDELHNMGDLIVLCKKCHRKEHGRN